MLRHELIQRFLQHHVPEPYTLTPVSGDASFRSYHRVLTPQGSRILMDAPPDKEDIKPYIAIADLLGKSGYSVPTLLAKDEENGLLLLEDFGDALFTSVLNATPARETELYQTAVDVLVEWHKTTPQGTLSPYSTEVLMREVSLFAQWYIPSIAPVAQGVSRAEEFLDLWNTLLSTYPQATTQFVHRDYHVSNLMWLSKRSGVQAVGLLDFQDALQGAPAYDLVSLLEDARRDVSPSLQMRMIDYYLNKTGLEREAFLASYALLGAQRNFKILGIFVRLWKRDGKAQYLNFIPRIWNYIMQDLQHPHLAPLKLWLEANMLTVFNTLPKDAA
jgi:N-acetylmuramate 1-kinase